MPWWSVLRDGFRRPRVDSSTAADRPSVQRHSTAESQPAPLDRPAAEQAWRDLPILQRTLAEPIEPAAPLDTFTGSLTAHQNPSFLAPLGHRVDPGSGGLVDGLADLMPGHPIFYSAAGELPVPTAAKASPKLAVQRTLAEWPARSASWPDAEATDPSVVDTVPMELPVVDVSAEGGSVVTGRGTSDAPLALTVPPPSPPAPQPRVQRHAMASESVPEEPVEAGAAGMEAIEGLTVSRLAESPALPVDIPTLGRTGDEPSTGVAAMPLSGPTGAATEPVGDAHRESGAGPKQGSHSAGRDALPIAPVQRQAAQAADLSVRRSWPVLPEQAVRAPSFPALPLVELPVARSAELVAPSAAQADPGSASDDSLARASLDSAASGGKKPTDAPLSGFAAAISALHAGDEADAPVQRAADPGAAGLDGPSLHSPSAAGIDGSAGTATGMPLQRLVVGPGESRQRESSQHGSGSTVGPTFGGGDGDAPTLGGGESDAPTLGIARPAGDLPAAGDLPGEATTQDRSRTPEILRTTDSPIAGSTGGHLPEAAASSPEVVDGRLVDDVLPELPVVAPDQPAAARGSVAMPVVGSAPVQRSAADPAGWTPVRTVGLLASRTPMQQLPQLSSAPPEPPPVQRLTFLTDTTPRGTVAQRLPAPPVVTQSPGRQHSSVAARAAGPAVRSVAALQRTADSATSGPRSAATTADPPGSAAASGQDRFSAFESDALGDSVRWEAVPLEQAADSESAARVVDGINEPAVVQRSVEFAAGPAAGPTTGTSEFSGSWAPADSGVTLDSYQAVRQAEPPAPPRRPATVMPPMPIVQRHAAADPAPTPEHRSSSAGISFTSMFSAASEAAETGYTTVQLQADDSSHALDAAESESATTASAGLAVQREGEAPPPSTPAPGGGPAGGAPAGGAPAGADLDEMARRLFEPLSARLRAEFWLDRERAGLMTDARP